jgi:hypothetical protein
LVCLKKLGRGGYSKDRLDMIHNVSDSYDLRISYEFQGPQGEFAAALGYWNDEHNHTFPDIFYLNIGAWYGTGSVSEEQVQRVTTGVSRLLLSTKRIIYGTSLFFRNHAFDDAVSVIKAKLYIESTFLPHNMNGSSQALHTQKGELQVFDRNSFSNRLFSDLKLERDSGHAPTLVNLFDAQRLVQLLSFDTYPRKRGENWFSPGYFHNNCTSSKTPANFISTWNQHCQMS